MIDRRLSELQATTAALLDARAERVRAEAELEALEEAVTEASGRRDASLAALASAIERELAR